MVRDEAEEKFDHQAGSIVKVEHRSLRDIDCKFPSFMTSLVCDNSATTTVQQQQCHNSKFVIFQEKRLKVLKCHNFLWVQQRHNCPPAANFANCVVTLSLLKVHLLTFLSITINKNVKFWVVTLLSQMSDMSMIIYCKSVAGVRRNRIVC